jgi:tRNA/rRNA methyltransferase
MLERVRIVLVRPSNPENLGAAARAMRNFGLADWAIVELATHDFAAARRVAVHAEDLLDRPRLCATLEEAVADCAWVVATTSRRVPGRRALAPDEVAGAAVARPGRTALVFGGERSGLNADAVRRCHDVSAIPAAAEQPSLNLAQAVLVYAWALRCAAIAAEARPVPARPAPALEGDLARVESALREALRGGGFLAGPERHAVADLARTLRRAQLSRREARLWLAALRRVSRALAGGR